MERSNISHLKLISLCLACGTFLPSIASAAQCKINVSYSNLPFNPVIVGRQPFVIPLNTTRSTNRKHMRKISNKGDSDVKIFYWDISGNHSKTIKIGQTKSVSGDLKRTQCKKLPSLPDLSVRTLDVQYKNGKVMVTTRIDNKGRSTPRSFKITASLYRNSTRLKKITETLTLRSNKTLLWEPAFSGSQVSRATKVKVKVDSHNRIRESNERNNVANRAFTPVRTAELSLRTVTVAKKYKRHLKSGLYRYTVKAKTRMDNGGSRFARLFKTTMKVQCKLNSNRYRTYKTKTITKSLSAGGTYLWQPTLQFTHRRSLNNCKVLVNIDSTNKIRENSEHDNKARKLFRFR